MARNIVILLVCGALVFGLVWKMAPGILATALPFPSGRAAVAEEEETQPAAEPEKPGAHKASKTVKSPKAGRPSNAVARNYDADAPAAGSHTPSMEPVKAQPTLQAYVRRRPHVTSDSATLYSSNAPTGRVLRVLKKDDPLELHFKV